MPIFFWFAQVANFITTVVALAAFLVVIWLGPRRRVNLTFAIFLATLIGWMSSSVVLRLLVNVPDLGGDRQGLLNVLAFCFALVGLTLFWFIDSLYPVRRRWRLLINGAAVLIYLPFIALLFQNRIVTDAHVGEGGILAFTITPLAMVFSSFQYVCNVAVIIILVQRRAWRERWHLTVGTVVIIVTAIVSLLIPTVAIQTYIIAFGTLFMTYELIKQQLFNPLLTMNQRLEAEVAARTDELRQSLAEQERVRSELAIAREIQLSLLPPATPDRPNLLLAARSIPAQEVGGDFYAYHMFSDGRLGVAVGDVSGKGIPAALLMALSLRTFEMLAEHYRDQGALLNAFNQALAPRLRQSKLNTAFLSVVIDQAGRTAAVANAGLIAPLLWRDGEVGYIDSGGLPLGAAAFGLYSETVVALQPGDRLLLLSDGLVEAMNETGEMWGFERLEAAFRAAGAGGPASIIEVILGQVAAFTAGAAQHDDVTAVVLQVR